MNEQEQRIREFAYEIWQTEGCPEGQGERHWEMARKLVEAQQSGLPMSLPLNKPRKSTTKPTDVSAGIVSAEQTSNEQSGTETAQAAKAPKATRPPGQPRRLLPPRATPNPSPPPGPKPQKAHPPA